MSTVISEYEQKAIDFLNISNTAFSAKYIKTDRHFDDDKEQRDIYEITLSGKGRFYVFKFGNSINSSGQYKLLDGGLIKRTGRNIISGEEYKKLGLYERREAILNKNFKKPTAYDVLSTITKCSPGTFEDFCADYGYNMDSRKAEKTYKAVMDEWINLERLFSESEMELLREIN